MNICFILPKFSRKPIGGFKIVYQYSNILCRMDQHIYIFYMNNNTFAKYRIPNVVKEIGNEILTKAEPTWMVLDKKIVKITPHTKNALDQIKKMDVVICTSIDTVEMVRDLQTKAKKAYFIQDYENWSKDDSYVQYTYGLGMINIVVSGWLKNIVDKHSIYPSYLVKNPIDINTYRQIVCQKERTQHTIGLLYHSAEHKGLKYAFEALRLLKNTYKDLTVKMFGTTKPNQSLPDWIQFTFCATEKQTVDIYNSVQVFLCATVAEGFGLTGLEAMACGAALASTEYDGVKEYAINEKNALLSPIKEPAMLAENVSRLFDDEELRERIVNNALEHVKNLSLEKAAGLFLKVLQ